MALTRHVDVARTRPKRWCPGGAEYVGIDDPKRGANPPTAQCPSCGRWTAFHKITGRFRRHLAPR